MTSPHETYRRVARERDLLPARVDLATPEARQGLATARGDEQHLGRRELLRRAIHDLTVAVDRCTPGRPSLPALSDEL
jgi:hypothetical protein